MEPLELETVGTKELVEELMRRHKATVMVFLYESKGVVDYEDVDLYYSGGLTTALGLVTRARRGVFQMIEDE